VKRALITGVTGQQCSYLAELLLEKGYEVHGVVRWVQLLHHRTPRRGLPGPPQHRLPAAPGVRRPRRRQFPDQPDPARAPRRDLVCTWFARRPGIHRFHPDPTGTSRGDQIPQTTRSYSEITAKAAPHFSYFYFRAPRAGSNPVASTEPLACAPVPATSAPWSQLLPRRIKGLSRRHRRPGTKKRSPQQSNSPEITRESPPRPAPES
jgi:hypothetical protein